MPREGIEMPRARSTLMREFRRAIKWDEQGIRRSEVPTVLRRLGCEGLEEAQFYLGAMYQHGDGVRRNYRLAREWYAMAARSGHSGALNNLGTLLAQGLGGAKDLGRALQLYRAASRKGDEDGAYNVGCCYEAG